MKEPHDLNFKPDGLPYLVGLSFPGIKGVNLAEICRDAPSPFRNAEQL